MADTVEKLGCDFLGRAFIVFMPFIHCAIDEDGNLVRTRLEMRKNQPVDMMARRLKAKKFVAETYTASLMSNTKWRALFSAFEEAGIAKYISTTKNRQKTTYWRRYHN